MEDLYSSNKDTINGAILRGYEINSRNMLGEIPLISACEKSEKLVEFLISNGASVNYTDIEGMTALHWSTKYSISKLLIDKGAIVNLRDNDGNTPLFYCNSREIAKLLIQSGSYIDIINNNGDHLLDICNVNISDILRG